MNPWVIKDKLLELQGKLNENYKEVADLLYEIWTNRYYDFYGYKSFYNFIDTELDIKPRKASYLVQLKKKFLKLGITWDDVNGIGWRKLACIVPVINRENWKEWVADARKMSLRELSEKVKGENDKEKETKHRMYFVFDDDEFEIVETVLEEGKHIYNLDNNSKVLKNILYEWYQNL